jgi:hypothetical protein
MLHHCFPQTLNCTHRIPVDFEESYAFIATSDIRLIAVVLMIVCGVDQLGVPFCQTYDLVLYISSSGIPLLSKGRATHSGYYTNNCKSGLGGIHARFDGTRGTWPSTFSNTFRNTVPRLKREERVPVKNVGKGRILN